MKNHLQTILLILQLLIFALGRILDDMSWYDVGVGNQVSVFEGVGLSVMALCVILQIARKHQIEGWWRILFVRSQLKFIIPWSLLATIVLLFLNIFGCQPQIPDGQLSYFYMTTKECALNLTQMLLTNLNYSLICNTKAHLAELILFEAVLFGEIIYNGNLFLMFINGLEGKPKDYCILLISLVIANNTLIMDLIFRAGFEDREREEEEEEKMLGHTVHPVPHKPQTRIESNTTLNNLGFIASNSEINQNFKAQ